MRVYYNEWDKSTAAWLRELSAGYHLPAGHVDTRSIRDVHAGDVREFDQCHFFAGIGGWPLALRLAGYEHLPCWTGSPPCQPFSVAGQRRGNDDERHLAPVWLDLVRKRRPPILFGEQVEAAIRHGWLDDLFDALEREGYTCGAAVLPACSVGAPHIRKRLFFGAVRLADAPSIGRIWRGPSQESAESRSVERFDGLRNAGRLADTDNAGPQRQAGMPECAHEQAAGQRSLEGGSADPRHSFWSGADWLGCRDGKFRPVEPGIFPLVDGFPSRMVTVCAGCETETRWMINGGSIKILQTLRPENASPTAAERQNGNLDAISSAQVLRPSMFWCLSGEGSGYESRSARAGTPNQEKEFMRTVRRIRLATSSPQRPEPVQQRNTQSGSSLRFVPQVGAQSPTKTEYLHKLRNFVCCAMEAQDGQNLFCPVCERIRPHQRAEALGGRVGLLRGAGNAIVPQVAATFIQEFIGAIYGIQNT
ncbi:DNA cytosine methyltransferase [Novacetimonas hansenii]|uniref:DNA cytosine methyltransferase n=1 Tax=Novacetimonas hansenii TaxID=436 RepID=UPI0015880F1E|nr:DNA cytosine methyltransferase [Novacetimonas hansenii]